MTTAVDLTTSPVDEDVAKLWEAVDSEFLAMVGWDPAAKVLFFPPEHPLLGWTRCRVRNCQKNADSSRWRICPACTPRWRSSGKSLEDFLADTKSEHRCIGVARCSVDRCERPAKTVKGQLCHAHHHQQRKILRLSLEAFLTHPDVVPLPGFGPCSVTACTRDRIGAGPYCHAHEQRWRLARRKNTEVDEAHWRITERGVAENNAVSLRGLPPLVVAQAVYGVQYRIAIGSKTRHPDVRGLCDRLRRSQSSSLNDLNPGPLPKYVRNVHSVIITAIRRLSLTPETERHKDVWELAAFGLQGTLKFTEISQPWLREATNQWAFDDLPRRRGPSAGSAVQRLINSVALLSESLHLQRQDQGHGHSLLARDDITAFCNRLAYLEAENAISARTRHTCCSQVRKVLNRMRSMGLTRSGRPLHGLPDDFSLTPEDIPDEPEDSEAGKDLPADVMRHLCQHLPSLEETSCQELRVGVELLIDTGRRPTEICQLGLNCLQQDQDGKPVLIYDNNKSHRKGRRLPIPSPTANLIIDQQERVRARVPDTPPSELKLLPAPTRNPDGRKAITQGWVNSRHRRWVNSLPDISVPMAVEQDGRTVTQLLPFDKTLIFPYIYRHTYAQRHADAGVDVTVLKELLNHRHLTTTQRYYNVRQERRREAVERVTTMQFDRHGNRVWRQAKALLDSEHARRAVGEVAVPYGGCSEPSNVAAGGQDCPVRFRCIGCGHFSTDISYLPDLERYLADLLRHRERLAATVDADEWAKTEAMPSDNEIKRIRRLIDRMNGDLDDLTDEVRAQIEEAVAVVRNGRARIVGLGIPRIRQPLPDLRPERTA